MLPDVSAPEALAAISAGAMEKTQILTVGAQSDDPDKAKNIAYAAANALIDRINQQQNDLKINESDRLVLSVLDLGRDVHADVPQPRRMVALFTLASIIVSIGALIVYENAMYG